MTRTIWNTLAILAVLIFTALPLSAAEVVTYYHNDHLGSPIAATDDTGTVVWQQAYDPWGAKLTVNTDERGYTGNWLDEETGLADHKARWYTSSIGRFTGIDPVKWHETNIHSFNRYSYSGNNPYTNTDVGGELFFIFHMNRRDMSTEHAMIAGQVGNAGAQTAMGLHAVGSAAGLAGGTARLVAGTVRSLGKIAIQGSKQANFGSRQSIFRVVSGRDSQMVDDVLMPNGKLVGQRVGRAAPQVRTVSTQQFSKLTDKLLRNAEIGGSYAQGKGTWYNLPSGGRVGLRSSGKHGKTLDIDIPRYPSGYKVHQK